MASLLRTAQWTVKFLRAPLRRPIYTFQVLQAPVVPFKLADIGEGIKEVQVKEWYVRVGDAVKEFDKLCEVQSDKASVTITCRYNGVVEKLYCDVDETLAVGSTLVDIRTNENDVAETGEPSQLSVERALPEQSKTLTTPAVRRIAKENKVNLSDVTPTGPGGRILKEDLLSYMSEKRMGQPEMPQEEINDQPGGKLGETVPLKGYNRAMFKTMSAANEIPHFTYCEEIVVDNLLNAKKALNRQVDVIGESVTSMPFYIKALSLALLRYPMMNAVYSRVENALIYKPDHNVSVAIATDQGLVVPCIMNCERKNVLEINRELKILRDKANRAKLNEHELANGTITLSNIGSIGGTYAKPILLPPQVAICALGRTRVLPRYNEELTLRAVSVVNVSWSADHRVLDGATVANFCNLWKRYLEAPTLMLSNMR